MIDREKVLKGLECCCQMNGNVCRTECPYSDECIENECVGTAHLCANALEFLKKQQETILSLQGTIRKLTAALAEQPKQKFFVDSDGKITPLPIQKHGHWKLVQDYYDDEHWKCSVCGCEWYLEAGNPEENNMHYCPECGAIMDLREDE